MSKQTPKKKTTRRPGRPKKTVAQLSKLWPTWREDILKLFSEGASRTEIKAEIDIQTSGKIYCSDDLWDRWLKEEQEFSGVIKRGLLLCKAWWLKNGRENIQGQIYEKKDGSVIVVNNFNYTGWYMNMKNRFGWADNQKQEISVKELPKIKFIGPKGD